MLDGILGVAEVLFFVPDVQEAKPWFAHLLGIEPSFDEKDYCAFHVSDMAIGIHPSDGKTQPGVGGQVTYWRVSDIHKTIAHFESCGCQVFRGPIVGIDEVWICQMKDPFGNVWGLMQNHGSKK